MIFAFKNGLFLIPNSKDVCEGIFFLLSQKLMVFFNMKGRLRQQLIYFRLLTSLHLHLFPFHALEDHLFLNGKPLLSIIHSL